MYDIENKDFNDKSELRKNNFIFNLDIDGFNGPLDLRNWLNKKLDITKISILDIDQYLNFIKKAKELDLHIVDYLVMRLFGIYKIEMLLTRMKIVKIAPHYPKY